MLAAVGSNLYAIAGMPPTWEQSALAACLERGDRCVLSHAAAARAWGLSVPSDGRIHLLVGYGRSSRCARTDVLVHRSRHPFEVDRTADGLPVTTVGRTLCDLAGELTRAKLSRAASEALGRRLTSPAALAACVEHLPTHLPGRQQLVELIGPWRTATKLDSPAEGDCLRLLADAGLPPPTVHHVVRGPRGFAATVDFAWPDSKLALEVNGFRWHANPRSHADDSHRANVLMELGWVVVQATPSELANTPGAVLAVLRRHLLP